MGKGIRVKRKRKKQPENVKSQDTSLIHPFLREYPEGGPQYLRRISTKSGKVLVKDQKWVTLPITPLDLRKDLVTPSKLTATVNGKFRVVAVPFSLKDLIIENGSYEAHRLIKGASSNFAMNRMRTIHFGTLKFYQNFESEIASQKDLDEGRVHMGKDVTIEFRDPRSNNWISLPHEGLTFNYDQGGYIYSCSILANEEINELHEYETYTLFNAHPRRIALALGIDVGNHLCKEKFETHQVSEIWVFFGNVAYIDHEEKFDLYRRGAVLSSINRFREDLTAVFAKTPDYSHQNEFRFFITFVNVEWDYESNPSLEVSMSPNFQLHCGFTYFFDEHEQSRNTQKPTSTQ